MSDETPTRIFLDANVLFAAAISPEGRSAFLFERAALGACVLLLGSPHVLEKARRNLAVRYPQAMERFVDLAGSIVPCAEAPSDVVAWAAEQGLPDNDAPVLAAAVHARADALVTGDRAHFGPSFGRILRGVRVMTLRGASEMFESM